MDSVNLQAKFEVRSFTRSWDNSEYLKNFVQSLDTPFKVVDFGTNQKRVYDILVRNSNLGPILHRFGDIAGFLRSRVTPPLFHINFGDVPVAPDRPCWGLLGSARAEALSYSVVQLFSKNSNLCVIVFFNVYLYY